MHLSLPKFIRYLSEGPAPGIGIGYVPIGVVEEIENLKPELHPLRFRDWNVFANPDIPTPETRIAQAVPLLYSERPRPRLREGKWEPSNCRYLGAVSAAPIALT